MNPVEQSIVIALGAVLVMVLGCAGMSIRQWWRERTRDTNDYHSEIARDVYGPDFTPVERQRCKRWAFIHLYGGKTEEDE